MITRVVLGPVYVVPFSSTSREQKKRENEVSRLKRQRAKEVCQNFGPDVYEIVLRLLANSYGLVSSEGNLSFVELVLLLHRFSHISRIIITSHHAVSHYKDS